MALPDFDGLLVSRLIERQIERFAPGFRDRILARSTHHAIGRRTQELAAAYLVFLETGDNADLARLGYPELSPADEEARRQGVPREIVARLVENLARLFGSSEIVGRIHEWQETYAATLIRCELGQDLLDEAEKVITTGIQPQNRWQYLHHLRIIRVRVGEQVGSTWKSVSRTASACNASMLGVSRIGLPWQERSP